MSLLDCHKILRQNGTAIQLQRVYLGKKIAASTIKVFKICAEIPTKEVPVALSTVELLFWLVGRPLITGSIRAGST